MTTHFYGGEIYAVLKKFVFVNATLIMEFIRYLAIR